MRIDEVLQRIQGEFVEMPGLRLTPAQAQRLWGLERDVCDALLGALVDAKFLVADSGWRVRPPGWSPADAGYERFGAVKRWLSRSSTHRCRPADYLPRQPYRPAHHPRSRATAPAARFVEG